MLIYSLEWRNSHRSTDWREGQGGPVCGTRCKMGGTQLAQTDVSEMENMSECRKPEEELMAHASLKLQEDNFSCYYFYQRGLMV